MNKEFTISILEALSKTSNEILTGDLCYKIFIDLDKLHPKFIEYNNERLYKIIYHRYTSYGEMKRVEIMEFLVSHLKIIEMYELDSMLENMNIE